MENAIRVTFVLLIITLVSSSTNNETCETILGKLSYDLATCNVKTLQLQTRLLRAHSVCVHKLAMLSKINCTSNG